MVRTNQCGTWHCGQLINNCLLQVTFQRLEHGCLYYTFETKPLVYISSTTLPDWIKFVLIIIRSLKLTSVIVHNARIAAPLYKSSLPVMSFVRDEVTMMTSSAMWLNSLIPKYTIRLKTGSLHWNSLVMAKNTSVASFAFSCSPWMSRYRIFDKIWVHFLGLMTDSLKARDSWRTDVFSKLE